MQLTNNYAGLGLPIAAIQIHEQRVLFDILSFRGRAAELLSQ